MNVDRTAVLEANQYFQEEHPKDMIVLHHTAGGSATSTINWWELDPRRVGTAYIIERDGTVFEVFPDVCWAYHLGLKDVPRGKVDKRSIGIEIASEGGLTEVVGSQGATYHAFDNPRGPAFQGQIHSEPGGWRGYKAFAAYTPAAVDAAISLVTALIEKHNIPKMAIPVLGPFIGSGRAITGVVSHSHLRSDKSDLHPGFPWERLIQECGLNAST